MAIQPSQVEALEPRQLFSLPAWVDAGSAATWDSSTKTLTVTGAATIIADPGTDEPNIVASGSTAQLTVAPATSPTDVHVGGISLDSGAGLTMASVGASHGYFNHNVLVLGSLGASADPTLSVDSSSTLDLEDNDLVVHTGSSDQGAGSTDELGVVNTNELALVAGVAARGRNVASGGILDGTWTGTGLTSSSAASVDAAAGYEEAILAVAQNSQLVLGSYSNWAVGSASETLASNDILVKYTSNGDLTLDGAADDNAQTVINGLYDNGASSNNPYALGDLNGDGKIDDNDVTIFNGIYGNGMPPSGLLATATDASSVSLNWTAAPGALSYNIYRKDPGASSYVQVGSTSSTTYTDASFESDTASSYEVTAVGPLGETAPSNATTARTLSDPAGGYVTLWGYTQSPAQPNASDPSASGGIELGVQFSSDSSGYISGVQFFKGIQNTGTHTGELWDAEGHLLATASFTNESQSGWQQVDFSSPVMISAGTPYIVSYHTTSTHYAHDAGYFSSSGQNNTPLHVAQGEGGLYAYGPSSFPSNAAGNDNYWVQPVFFSAFAAPVGLSAVAASDSEIDLSCANIVPDVTSIQVQRSVGGGSFSTIATLDPSQLGYPDRQGLSENTQYTYQLVLQLSTGAAVTSMPAVAYTLPAVDGLQAVAVSDSEIDLSWNSNAPNASGFVVQQLINGVWTMLATTSTPSYPVTGLSPDQDYTFQVCAILPSGYSQFTGPADAYTLPAAPSSLTAAANGTNEIDLSWPTDDANVYGYELQRSDDGGQTFSAIAQLDPDTTSYTDTDVLDGTEYQYQLIADNGSGESDPSAIVSATTDMAVPTELTAAAPDGSGVQLAWVNNSQTATSFIVQRSTDGVNFSNVTLDDNGIDTAIVSGTEYYYQVIARNDTTQSAPSDMVQVTPLGSIVAVDDTPVTGVSFQVAHGKSITLYASQLLGNDIDSNTSPQMSIKSFTNPSGGTLTDNGDGTFTYAANSSFVGSDSFTYTPTDQYNAQSNAATVQIVVTDQRPEAASGHIPVVEAQDSMGNWLNYPAPVNGTMSASDGDGDPLTFSASIISGPGSLSYNASTGDYTYTPSQSASGAAVIAFTANDGALTSNRASLIFPGWQPNNTDPDEPDNDGDEIIAGQNLPYASNQYYSVNQGATLHVAAAGLLYDAYDTDTPPDSDTLSVDPTLIEPPQHGSVTINNTDGSFTYTPDPSFSGRDYFTWQVDDGSKKGDYATAFIDVQPVTVSMKLTVGDASDPAPPEPPQGTPFIPIDDGYDSDSQSVPNDQLNPPDASDPELVPASLTMSSNIGLWGTWSLSFPSSVRVFQVQSDGGLTELTSGDQSAPVAVNGSPTLSFMVQGVGPQAVSALIVATMAPASDPTTGNPPPITQSTTKSVTANVGPSPLQVLSVNKNVAGDALTPAQVNAGIFLPISNPQRDLNYQLTVNITNLPKTAAMQIPANWELINAFSGQPVPLSNGVAIFQPTASNPDVPPYYLEALNSAAPNTPVKFSLSAVDAQNRIQGRVGSLGAFTVTPFVLSNIAPSKPTSKYTASGPQDVPQFGTYEYKVTPLKGGVNMWLPPDGGTVKRTIVANDVQIQWLPGQGGGPLQGQAVYEANAQFIWEMPVNVMQIIVTGDNPFSTTGNVKGSVVTVPQNGQQKPIQILAIQSDKIGWSAQIQVVEPDAPLHGGGAGKLQIGFVQNIQVQSFGATYGGTPLLGTIGRSGPFIQGPNTAYWDAADRPGVASAHFPDSFYFPRSIFNPASAKKSKLLSGDDSPNLEPVLFLSGRGIQSTTLEWNMTTFVAALSKESPSMYVAQASAAWTFNGTGNLDNRTQVWTGQGAKVTPPTPNAWTPADANTKQPTTSGVRFNDITEGGFGWSLPPKN